MGQAEVVVDKCEFEGNTFAGGLINGRETVEINRGNLVGASWTAL